MTDMDLYPRFMDMYMLKTDHLVDKEAMQVWCNLKQQEITKLQSALAEKDEEIKSQIDTWVQRCLEMANIKDAEITEKDELWQIKYDELVQDYEQKWGLSMRLQEEIARLKAENEGLDDFLRKFLLFSHGHSAPYLDDGEMQCGLCVPNWDYKRLDIQTVVRTAVGALLKKVKELEAENEYYKKRACCDPINKFGHTMDCYDKQDAFKKVKELKAEIAELQSALAERDERIRGLEEAGSKAYHIPQKYSEALGKVKELEERIEYWANETINYRIKVKELTDIRRGT